MPLPLPVGVVLLTLNTRLSARQVLRRQAPHTHLFYSGLTWDRHPIRRLVSIDFRRLFLAQSNYKPERNLDGLPFYWWRKKVGGVKEQVWYEASSVTCSCGENQTKPKQTTTAPSPFWSQFWVTLAQECIFGSLQIQCSNVEAVSFLLFLRQEPTPSPGNHGTFSVDQVGIKLKEAYLPLWL